MVQMLFEDVHMLMKHEQMGFQKPQSDFEKNG